MSGPLWLLPGGRAEPFEALGARLGDVCAAAVHPDEVAALLESEGLTDEQVRRAYGRGSVFQLAAELYERSPRRFPEPPLAPDPWRADGRRCVQRGIVFALPVLAYVVGARLLTGPTEMLLAVSVLYGWGWNQALAHRAYVLLGGYGGSGGRAGRAAAARCLLAGGTAGALAVAVPAVAVPALLEPGALSAGVFAAGQACYLGAATALLVLERERLLLAALAPVVLGAAALLVAEPSAAVTAVLLTAAAALATGAAVAVSARELRAAGAAPAPVHGWDGPGLLASLPYGLFGFAAAALTLLMALGDVLRHGPGAPFSGTAVLALVLSMGAAEWLLYRVRGLTLGALRRHADGWGFRAVAAGVVAGCLTAYLAMLGLLVLPAGVAYGWWEGHEAGPVRFAALLALGAVLWLALLLQACGVAWPSAAVCVGAAACEVALLAGDVLAPARAQLAVGAAAAGVLFAVACAVLGRVTAHR